MINFLSKATNRFGKIFTVQALLFHGFSQQVFCNEKEKIAYIDLVKRSFQKQEDELVQKTFSQPLDLMGLEKSPLAQEIFQQKDSISDFCIFKPLLLKAAIHLFDDDLVNFRQKEMYLDFNENAEEMIIRGEIRNNPMKFFFHVNNITGDIVENLERINGKKEKAHYFFKNFNTFAKNKNLSFISLHSERFNNISTTKIFYDFKNFLGIFQENCGEYIEKYFSKDFFITSCRRLFPYFNDIECLKFFQLYCTVDLKIFFKDIYRTLEKNRESIDLSHNSFVFLKTEKKFYEAFENLLIPLKSFFVFHYYNTSLPNSLPELGTEEEFLSYSLRKDSMEVKISRELVLQDMESFYTKKAFQAIYKILFISFMSKDSSFKFLGKFDAASYNHCLFQIMNTIKPHLTKEKIAFHDNIYTSKNFFNFAVCSRSQFKYKGDTRNFISFSALEYFVESEDYFDILGDKDNKFFQKIDNSLEFLKIFSAPECSYIIFYALDRIKFLKKNRKIKLS